MINQSRLVQNFITMVEIDSESREEAKLKDWLQNQFAQRGIKGYEDESGAKIGGDAGNLFLKVPGLIERPPLFFTAHMDTVKPGKQVKAVVADGVIRSGGNTILGADNKADIAVLLEAIDVLQEQGALHIPLEILLTVAEEQGLLGSKHFDFSLLSSPMGYALDAGGKPGTIVIQSPCQNHIEYKALGKAAHAGIDPEKGINAIHLAALALSKMPSGRIDEDTTCNFGMIEGGQARNIIPDSCVIQGEARSMSRQQLNQITRELSSIFTTEVEKHGGRAEVKVEFLYPEVSLDAGSEVVLRAVKAAEKTGLPVELVKTGGGSDASIINGQEIPCVNLAIGMQAVHTCDEYISVQDLVNDVKLVLALIAEAADPVY